MKKKVLVGMLVSVTVMGAAFAYAGATFRGVTKADNSKVVSQVAKDDKTKSDVNGIEAEYKKVVAEEEYIAKLVSQKTRKKVTSSDWKECLSYLETNYDTLVKDSSLDTSKIKSYVEAYKVVKADESTSDTATAATAATPIATGVNDENYDVSKVKKYLEKYYENYNPKYPDYNEYGGDCANFVSQALYAGGKKMKGTNASSFNNWFCRTSRTAEISKVSSTWRGAEAFASYWKKNALEYKEFSTDKFSNRKSFKEVYDYANEGDAISFLLPTGRAYHTVIVSYKNRSNDGEIRFAAHTSSHIDYPLYEYVYGAFDMNVRVYKMSSQYKANENNMTVDEYAAQFDEDEFEGNELEEYDFEEEEF